MALGEFDLIQKYFTRPSPQAVLGVGDDCALLQPRAGMLWAISSDMLVEGRHFLSTVRPERLGHKALAVNLSDLAACGATPVAFTLALALPRIDEVFLAGLAQGLFELAAEHGIELVGGDTTAGPLTICITVFGEVPRGQALLRSGARAGDDVYVSGTVGGARLALDALRKQTALTEEWLAPARARLERPTPRVALALSLRGIATAAIDVSDGLLGDLGHILGASGVGACIDSSIAITLIADYADANWSKGLFSYEEKLACVLAGGDDYELAFTAPNTARAAVAGAAAQAQTPVTRIVRIEATPGLRLIDAKGQLIERSYASFDHFA